MTFVSGHCISFQDVGVISHPLLSHKACITPSSASAVVRMKSLSPFACTLARITSPGRMQSAISTSRLLFGRISFWRSVPENGSGKGTIAWSADPSFASGTIATMSTSACDGLLTRVTRPMTTIPT